MVACVALALVFQALPGLAATPHRKLYVVKHGARVSARTRVGHRLARKAREYGGPGIVYGESAPYYVYGRGWGDAFGDDPIGGPEHVGNGGPGVNFGGGFRPRTDEEVIDGAGVIGGSGR